MTKTQAPSVRSEPAFDTFISYASVDREVAEQLRTALIHEGLRPWVAFADIPGGSRYAAEIVQAIAGCRTLVLLVSNASVQSDHVFREVAEAAACHRQILPVYLQPSVPLPPQLRYYLRGLHRLKVEPAAIEAAVPKIAAGIRRHEQWQTDASAPGLVESLSESPRRAWATLFGVSLLAGISVWVLQAIWRAEGERAETVRRDQLPEALALLQLVDATLPPGADPAAGPWWLSGSVILAAPDLPFSQLRLRLLSRTGPESAPEVFELIPEWDYPEKVGGSNRWKAEVPRLGASVTACLSLPHPRRAERWQVIQAFSEGREPITSDQRLRVYASSAPASAAKDNGASCR